VRLSILFWTFFFNEPKITWFRRDSFFQISLWKLRILERILKMGICVGSLEMPFYYLTCYTNQRCYIAMKLYVPFTKLMNFECNSHEHNNHKLCNKRINTKVAYYILPTYAWILLPSLQIFNMWIFYLLWFFHTSFSHFLSPNTSSNPL